MVAEMFLVETASVRPVHDLVSVFLLVSSDDISYGPATTIFDECRRLAHDLVSVLLLVMISPMSQQ